MSIGTQARLDFKANLDSDGDAVTIIPPVGDPIPAFGFANRIEARLDPQLGIQIVEKKNSVTVSNIYFTSEPDDTWKLQTTDSEGNVVESYGIDRRTSRKIGFVTFFFEEYT